MSSIRQTIAASVNKISTHPEFLKFIAKEKVDDGNLIVLNNSFVFRDLNTTKADHYLVITFDSKSPLQRQLSIARNLNQNVDFRRFHGKQGDIPALESIDVAIESQLDNIGNIVFGLIGCVDDSVIIEHELKQTPFEKVIWNPSQPDLTAIYRNSISIKSPYDEDNIWSELLQLCQQRGIDLPEKFKHDFGVALDKLQENAVANLYFPERGKNEAGVTDLIIRVLIDQRDDYANAVSLCKGDGGVNEKEFNQVLRIAYNFACDATTFLRLIVSVCDLKPIIFWATIGEHYALSEAFKSLPFTRSKAKASLKNYIDTIGDARNGAFHKLFPFQKALKLALPGSAFRIQSCKFSLNTTQGKPIIN